MTQEDLFKKYAPQFKLTRWPFALTPLDPQTLGEDKLYVEVEGFGQQAQIIRDWFSRPEIQKQPSYVLVYGPIGCGRSSVANFVFDCYSRVMTKNNWKIERIRPVNIKDNNKMKYVQEAMRNLYRYLKDNTGETFTLDTRKTLGEAYENDVIRANKPANVAVYRELFLSTLAILEDPKLMLVFVMDNVSIYEQIENSIEVFAWNDLPRLLLFTTSDESIKDSFKTRNAGQSNFLSIELRHLVLDEVRQFVTLRWQALTGSSKHPYPDDGVQYVFAFTQTWSFRAVTTLLYHLFEEHLDNLAKAGTEPADLAMSVDFMKTKAIDIMRRIGMLQITQ